MSHLPTCSVGNAQPCPSDKSLHDEPVGTHWWSGWPGAYCMKCGASDPVEECLADCECVCHAHDFDDLARINAETSPPTSPEESG